MSIWSRFENWGHFVSGILMCVLGICLIFFNTYFVAGVTWWTGILLTLVGLFRAVEVFLPKHKAQGSKARLLNLVSALAHIILGTIVMTWSGDAAKLLSFGVGLYQLMIGLVSLFTYYLLQKDRAKGRLKELVIGLITFFWGIGTLLSTRSVRDTLVLVGIYVIFIGITWLIDARDLLMTDKTKQRKRRRWRVGVPVFFTMLIPADIHSKINHLLNDEVSPEEVEETLIPQVKKKVKGDPVLKVFIHVSEGIFGSVGHVDLSYKGRVYSYGSYDVDSERVFSAVGDGCFFTLDDKEVRRINTDITPLTSVLLITLDLKLGHSTVAVVVNLQAEVFNLVKIVYFNYVSVVNFRSCLIKLVLVDSVDYISQLRLAQNHFFHFKISIDISNKP